VTPPILHELLRNLDEWLYANIRLIATDPDLFYRVAEIFVAWVGSKAYRAGARDQMRRLTRPSEN
jgi:hypothetical protein